MPRWNKGELIDAPTFTRRNWFLLLGPALLSGGSAIGGGEWLMGPAVTARYGGAIMWLATLSILGQVVYNIEISRYTLYTGEPIFTGKFRTLPGPPLLADDLPRARLRRHLPLPGRQRRHAPGGGDPGPHPRRGGLARS